MIQEEFLTSNKINKITPHINEYFLTKFKEAIVELEDSDAYLAKMEEFLSTDEYDKILENYTDDTADKYVSWIKKLVDEFYDADKDKDFSYFVRNTIEESYFLRNAFNLRQITSKVWQNKASLTEDDYVEVLTNLVNEVIEDTIISHQKNYATSELKVLHFPNWQDRSSKLNAVLATAQCGSLSEIEKLVDNSFDWQDIIIRKENEDPCGEERSCTAKCDSSW
jgi:hypothetical protein